MNAIPVGTGIDIIEIERIAAGIDRFGERFLRKLFTAREIAYCSGKCRPEQHYAARFAAKEAVYKAADMKKLWFTNIEIENTVNGKPRVRFINVDGLSGEQFLLSISHTHDHATAVAIRLG